MSALLKSSALLKAAHSPTSALRIFDGSGSDSGGPGDSLPTLTQFCATYALDTRASKTDLARRKPRTHEAIKNTMRHWAAATGDPPVDEIESEHHAAFLAKLRADGLDEVTVCKECVHLNRVVRLLGPRTRWGREAQNADLLADLPLITVPRRPRKQCTREFQMAEFGLLLGSCVMLRGRRIAGVPVAEWFPNLLLVAYFTLLRWQELRKLAPDWIDGEWLTVPASAAKTGDARTIYLHEEARTALASMGAYRCGRGKKWVYDRWAALRRAAGVESKNRAFHAIRKLAYTELSTLNSDAAKLMAGHRGTSIEFYAGKKIMQTWVPRMPRPPLVRHQHLLFD